MLNLQKNLTLAAALIAAASAFTVTASAAQTRETLVTCKLPSRLANAESGASLEVGIIARENGLEADIVQDGQLLRRLPVHLLNGPKTAAYLDNSSNAKHFGLFVRQEAGQAEEAVLVDVEAKAGTHSVSQRGLECSEKSEISF